MLMKSLLIPVVITMMVLPSCFPDYGLDVEDYRAVFTQYDTAVYDNPAAKAELRSFYLVDSVFHVIDPNSKDTITRAYDRQLLSFVASNFRSLNWTQITDTAGGVEPSTIIRVSVSTQTNIGYYLNSWNTWDPYWGGGWWGYPGWGWGGWYPPYWGGSGRYTYATGSLFVQQDRIVPASNPSDTAALHPIWLGTSNGLLTSDQQSNINMLSVELRQMFTQSPYLALPLQP